MMRSVFSEIIDVLHIFLHFSIAGLAGIMKELHKIESKGFSFSRLLASAAVSSFVGVTIFFILAYFELNVYLIAFSTSIAGWLGGNTLDYAGLLLKRYVGNKFNTDISIDDEKKHSELINK